MAIPKERIVSLPHPYDKVWDTTNTILQNSGWTITKSDKPKGHFLTHVPRMGLLGSPETLYIDLVMVDDKTTGLRIGGILPQFLDMGLNSSYIESFLTKLQDNLNGQIPDQKEPNSHIPNPAE